MRFDNKDGPPNCAAVFKKLRELADGSEDVDYWVKSINDKLDNDYLVEAINNIETLTTINICAILCCAISDCDRQELLLNSAIANKNGHQRRCAQLVKELDAALVEIKRLKKEIRNSNNQFTVE